MLILFFVFVNFSQFPNQQPTTNNEAQSQPQTDPFNNFSCSIILKGIDYQ